MSLLEVKNLTTLFHSRAGVVRAVDGVSFSVDSGQTLAIVGESGSGKSVTALSIMGLVPAPGRITGGEIVFQGRDLVGLGAKEMRRLRGRDIGMVFQDPMASLNPVLKVGDQIAEAVEAHEGVSHKQALSRAVEMMGRVRIPDAAGRALQYPHQLSGGLRQRVMIAMALACKPKLLIADEPTTALDVTIQAEILTLISGLQRDFQVSIILITHDLGVVAQTADKVAVMYAGQIVEQAGALDIFREPRHPYTEGLLLSAPDISSREVARRRLAVIPGSVPSLIEPPPGCRFAPRCDYKISDCISTNIPIAGAGEGRLSRCLRAGDVGLRLGMRISAEATRTAGPQQ